MRSLLSLLALLLLVACDPIDGAGDPADRSGFGLADEEDPDDDATIDDLDDTDDQDDSVDPPDDPEMDDDDVGDEEQHGWDVSPPEEPGAEFEGTISCGWLTGPLYIVFRYDGEGWMQQHTEDDGVGPRPELLPCFGAPADPEFDHRMRWEADGSMFFQAGGLDHDLTPTDTELRWLGPVYPTGGPSAECAQALEDAGVSSPMTMSLTIHSITTSS